MESKMRQSSNPGRLALGICVSNHYTILLHCLFLPPIPPSSPVNVGYCLDSCFMRNQSTKLQMNKLSPQKSQTFQGSIGCDQEWGIKLVPSQHMLSLKIVFMYVFIFGCLGLFVAAGAFQLWYVGCSFQWFQVAYSQVVWAQQLWLQGPVAPRHMGSAWARSGNLYSLHWKADSQPQGSPRPCYLYVHFVKSGS